MLRQRTTLVVTSDMCAVPELGLDRSIHGMGTADISLFRAKIDSVRSLPSRSCEADQP